MSCNYKKISTLLGFQDVVDIRRVLSRPDFSTVIILFLIYKKQNKKQQNPPRTYNVLVEALQKLLVEVMLSFGKAPRAWRAAAAAVALASFLVTLG